MLKRTAVYLCILLTACSGDDESMSPIDQPTTDDSQDEIPTTETQTSSTCRTIRAGTLAEKRKIDIIMTVDQSASMADEIHAIESSINNGLNKQLEQHALDFRVTLLAYYGSSQRRTTKVIPMFNGLSEDFWPICIAPPLGGNACDLNPLMVDVNKDGVFDLKVTTPQPSTRFVHLNEPIDSDVLLDATKYAYNVSNRYPDAKTGWSGRLRSDALPVFLVFSDDEGVMTADQFENWLFSDPKHHFGTAAQRRYKFYSITGVLHRNDANDPWLPTEDVQVGCNRFSQTNSAYQDLSRRSGSLRFSLCQEPAKLDFERAFKVIGEQLNEHSVIRCEYNVPSPPAGKSLDLDAVRAVHKGADGVQHTLTRRSSAGDCKTHEGFYVDNNRVKLCPTTCSTLTKAEDIGLVVDFGCET